MKVIYKYPIPDPDCVLKLPQDAQILCVQMQSSRETHWREQPCIWALVDPEYPTEERKFVLVATGQPFEYLTKMYLGTVQVSPNLVFHVFEEMAWR